MKCFYWFQLDPSPFLVHRMTIMTDHADYKLLLTDHQIHVSVAYALEVTRSYLMITYPCYDILNVTVFRTLLKAINNLIVYKCTEFSL